MTVTFFACALPGAQPGMGDAGARAPMIDPAQIPLATFGQLPVFITWQGTDGRNIHLRGLVANPYPETIEGIRVIVRILGAVDLDARELDRTQTTTEDRLASGEQTSLRLDIQTMYAGQSGGSGFTLEGFAITRGGRTLPLPPDWRE